MVELRSVSEDRGVVLRRTSSEHSHAPRPLLMMSAVLLATLLSLPVKAGVGVGNNAVGMNAHVATQAFVDGVEDLGASWIRLDGDWWSLHRGPNNFTWGHLDAAVERSNAAGLNVLITFAYTPDWVPRSGTDGIHRSDVPNSSAEWVDFLSAAVPRYRAMGVRHFGIWNEPNLEQFFNGTAEEYVDTILIPGAAAVRGSCSDCYVVGPHLSHNRTVDDYLRTVLSRAGAGIFDIIAHHTYHGFTETGRDLWDRKFENTLDVPCAWYVTCSDPIRDVLDEFGYDGEFWMTETGYRADPGDAGEEDTQATFLIRAMEEQLLRDWYTLTFFYEIHDCGPDLPGCTIDGFGVMRATGGSYGSRSFPGNFRLKPSFHALKAFIEAHPELTSDVVDPGEPAEPEEVFAYRNAIIAVDGDLADFGDEGWIDLGSSDWVGIDGATYDGTRARLATRWSASALYIGVEVEKTQHYNDHDPHLLWMGDSLQVAFDMGLDGGFGYDDVDDHEMGFALSSGQSVSHRFHGPAGVANDWATVTRRGGERTIYEVEIRPQSLGRQSFVSGQVMGFSILVNVADASGRRGWLELTPGIGAAKAPEHFAKLVLLSETSEGDANGNGNGENDNDEATATGSSMCSAASSQSQGALFGLLCLLAFALAIRRHGKGDLCALSRSKSAMTKSFRVLLVLPFVLFALGACGGTGYLEVDANGDPNEDVNGEGDTSGPDDEDGGADDDAGDEESGDEEPGDSDEQDEGDDEEPDVEEPGWVEDGLVALYTFQEGSGTTIFDVSGVGPALNLVIQNQSAALWSDAGLTLHSSTIAVSSGPATKVHDAVTGSDEITVEAWITPATANQDGPARIVTSSTSHSLRNFTLGQRPDFLQFRLRTTTSSTNGFPGVESPLGLIGDVAIQAAYTRNAAGEARLFVNGALVRSETVSGSVSSWDNSYTLALGNELTMDRPWMGTYHRVAIYGRALTDAEIASHFELGLDELDFDVPEDVFPEGPSESLGSPGAGGGFLWKPVSESDGKLVVLLPTQYKGHVTGCHIVSPTGAQIETGRFVGDTHNGNRPHYRFNSPGSAYGTNIYVVANVTGGNVHWHIPNGANRTEY